MALEFSSRKAPSTTTRKLKFLPRFGLMLDIGGREFTIKQASIFEAIANMKRKEINFHNLKTISNKILNEISVGGKKVTPRKRKVIRN